MSLHTLPNNRPQVPHGDLIYTQTPTPEGLVTQERPGQEDSWELGSQEEALPDAGNTVSVHTDGTGPNVGSAAAAAEKMSAPIPSDAASSEKPKTPNIPLHASAFCAFTSLLTAGSGAIMTLLALNQLPRNSGNEHPKPGEFGVSVTLAAGFFVSAVAATGTAIACGVRYYRERDSQVEAQATV